MMKSPYKKRKTRFLFKTDETKNITAHGGQVLVDALCRRLGLWEQMAGTKSLDARKRKGAGHDPDALAAQMIFGLTSGAVTLQDMERLGSDRVLLEAVGLDQAADASTLGEWLRAPTPESVEALARINARFVGAVLSEAAPGRVRHAGELEVFFDDTEVELHGHQVEGARWNDQGDMALSWQTVWCGPFPLDGILEGATTVAEHPKILLDTHQELGASGASDCLADSGSSETDERMNIRGSGFTPWSVSYNRWTDALERLAKEIPEPVWGERESDEEGTAEEAWLKHRPGPMKEDQTFSVGRRKKADEWFYRYAFIACESNPERSPRAVMERRRLKGGCEQRFSEVLSDLDLHHPPCLSLVANPAFYALATLADNLLTALKVLDLPDHAQGWRVRTIIRHLWTVPATVVAHANRWVLK